MQRLYNFEVQASMAGTLVAAVQQVSTLGQLLIILEGRTRIGYHSARGCHIAQNS